MFALLYFLVPNKKVKFGAAFVGGTVGILLVFEQCLRLPLRFARGDLQQNLWQSRPRAGIHGRALFFVADSAVWRAGRLRLSKPEILFAGKLVENVNQRGREFIALG